MPDYHKVNNPFVIVYCENFPKLYLINTANKEVKTLEIMGLTTKCSLNLNFYVQKSKESRKLTLFDHFGKGPDNKSGGGQYYLVGVGSTTENNMSLCKYRFSVYS